MYFEIGIYRPKYYQNVGTLFRSAYQLGASGIFIIGQRYKKQASDTYNTSEQIPFRQFLTFDDFLLSRPYGAVLVGIEMEGIPLSSFSHPKKAIYLLGAEDRGLPKDIFDKCNSFVSIESVRQQSYNVAMAGSIVMYDRLIKLNSYLNKR